MEDKEAGLFPDDLCEMEHVVELILDDAEGLNRLPYKTPDEAIEWGSWNLLLRWLRPRIEALDAYFGCLPDNQADVEDYPPGWGQDLTSLYVLLNNHTYGATWESGDQQGRLNAEAELTNAILKVKAGLEDATKIDRAKKEAEAQAARKAYLNKIRPKIKYNEDLQLVIDGIVSRGDTFKDLERSLRLITPEDPRDGQPNCDQYFFDSESNELCWTDRSGNPNNSLALKSLRRYFDRSIKNL